MAIFIFPLALIAGLYYVLKSLRLSWTKEELPRWMTFVGGILAWIFVLSLAAWGLGLVVLLAMALSGNTGALWAAAFAALLTGMVFKFKGIIDYEEIWDFVWESIFFRDYSRTRRNIFIDLEQHKVNETHKKTGGQSFESLLAKGKKINRANPERLRQEALRLHGRPIQSPHLRNELNLLRNGNAVNLSDSWRINCLQTASHAFYSVVSDCYLDPNTGHLEIKIVMDNLDGARLQNPNSLFRFKQNLYDFLQAVHQERWMNPYMQFVKKISCTCFGTLVDAFGQPQRAALLMADITVGELRRYAGKFFNAGELRTTIIKNE